MSKKTSEEKPRSSEGEKKDLRRASLTESRISALFFSLYILKSVLMIHTGKQSKHQSDSKILTSGQTSVILFIMISSRVCERIYMQKFAICKVRKGVCSRWW